VEEVEGAAVYAVVADGAVGIGDGVVGGGAPLEHEGVGQEVEFLDYAIPEVAIGGFAEGGEVGADDFVDGD